MDRTFYAIVDWYWLAMIGILMIVTCSVAARRSTPASHQATEVAPKAGRILMTRLAPFYPVPFNHLDSTEPFP